MHVCVHTGVYLISTGTNLGCFLFPVQAIPSNVVANALIQGTPKSNCQALGRLASAHQPSPRPLPEHRASLPGSFLPEGDCVGIVLAHHDVLRVATVRLSWTAVPSLPSETGLSALDSPLGKPNAPTQIVCFLVRISTSPQLWLKNFFSLPT